MKITPPEGKMTLREAAQHTGYTVMHLQRLCAADKVPHSRRGKYYFFTAEDIAKIVGGK